LPRGLASIPAAARLHAARIARKAFALDQAGIHASPHYRLEHMAQEVAVAEAAVPIDRECRVVRYGIIEIEAAKPAVSEMQFDLLAQSPLEADAIAVAHDQHPNHKLGVDRGPTNLAIEGRELLAHVRNQPRHDRINPTQEMARRNALLEIE